MRAYAADAPAPLDVGNGLVVASLGSGGAWLSLGAAHPVHGFVELNGLPPFDPAWRGDADAVRRYRGWMSAGTFAFLRIEVASAEPPVTVRQLRLEGTLSAHEVRCLHRSQTIETTVAADRPQIAQHHRIAGARRIVVRFQGRLDAHALAEITETDPPAPTDARARLAVDGHRLAIVAPGLPATAEIAVSLTGAHSYGWVVDRGAAQLVAHTREEVVELTVRCSLVTPGTAPRAGATTATRRVPVPGRTGALHVPGALRPALELIADRARAYVLACTALRIGAREVCLVTDHRILPLSWTRDAYWQAALLLAHGHTGVVADHLRWLWARCERPETLWSRSHHTSGAIKDRALQADQQLYPVLELADYVRATGRLPEPLHGGDGVAWWSERVADLWRALPAGRHGFLRSDENPADDRSELPYPLSAQILYWHTATRLAPLEGDLRLGLRMAATADEIRRRVGRMRSTVAGPTAPTTTPTTCRPRSRRCSGSAALTTRSGPRRWSSRSAPQTRRSPPERTADSAPATPRAPGHSATSSSGLRRACSTGPRRHAARCSSC
jgi:hypothetical protein